MAAFAIVIVIVSAIVIPIVILNRLPHPHLPNPSHRQHRRNRPLRSSPSCCSCPPCCSCCSCPLTHASHHQPACVVLALMTLFRSAALISGLTLLSRLTGLLRENLTAVLFGSNAFTDAFFVAFRLPNLLRRLFAEGAFSQAFVPLLARVRLASDPEEYRRLIDQTASVLFWFLLAVSVAGAIAAPALVWLMAGGMTTEAEAMQAAVTMARWMFPYILPISLVAFASAVLNAEQHFAAPAFTPVLLNVSMIAAALAFHDSFEPPVFALAAGVTLGAALQLALQWWALSRLGKRPALAFRRAAVLAAWQAPATRDILMRMGPAVLAVSAAQLSLVINTHIASTLGAGRVSWVSFADRLMEFPTALLGVALGTVLLPGLSRASAAGDVAAYSSQLDWGLRVVLLLALPASLGLGLLAEPLTALLYHYGKFTALDVRMTAQAGAGYAVGLLGLIAVKVLAPGYYAQLNLRTPVSIALAVLVLTQLLNLVTVPLFGHAGLALSISLAALCNALLLLVGLVRRGMYQPQPGWLRLGSAVLLACAVLAGWLIWARQQHWLAWESLADRPLERAAMVLLVVAVAVLGYGAVLALLGVRWRTILRR